jgi:PPK2 family polyphosphate:nucleotide phosphotransferase
MSASDDFRIPPRTAVDLNEIPTAVDPLPGKTMTIARTAELIDELRELQKVLWAEHQHRVLVVLQARDGGGKDGTVRNVFGSLNPQGVRVASFKEPTAPELARDYLWRVHAQVPADGEIVIFNRSHYEDVLVTLVHGLITKAECKQRYPQIRAFESLLVDEGTTIVKFFLHISKDEQRARLQARVDDPTKHWKFSETDLKERDLWPWYQSAYDTMIRETSTGIAPWYVIPANHKWFRDHAIATVMVDTLRDLHPEYPKGNPGLKGLIID